MATKIDLGKMVTDLFNTGLNYLNNRIGSGNSPLTKPIAGSGDQVKVGNVGGLFGINLNITTLLLIGVGIFVVIFVAKKI